MGTNAVVILCNLGTPTTRCLHRLKCMITSLRYLYRSPYKWAVYVWANAYSNTRTNCDTSANCRDRDYLCWSPTNHITCCNRWAKSRAPYSPRAAPTKPADVPTTEPEIPNVWIAGGKEVPLGLDVPGSDDCISISPNSPNAGDTTYTFQSEPDSSGNKSIVEVVYDANGTVYLKMQKKNSHCNSARSHSKQEDSDTLTSFMEKAKIAFGKLRGLFQQPLQNLWVTHHEPTQHEALALHNSYPTLEELPQNVLYPQTYQWV